MAIEVEAAQSVTISRQDRTWAIEITREYGSEPVITAHRETITLKGDTPIGTDRSLPRVIRTLSQIESRDFGGITGGELLNKLALVADDLRREDITNAKRREEESAAAVEKQRAAAEHNAEAIRPKAGSAEK